MDDNKEKNTGKINPFTFNAEKTGQVEIPSVTKLLNRKKFQQGEKSIEEPAREEPKLEMQSSSSEHFPILNTVLETDTNSKLVSSDEISIKLDAPEPMVDVGTSRTTRTSSKIVLETFQPQEPTTSSGISIGVESISGPTFTMPESKPESKAEAAPTVKPTVKPSAASGRTRINAGQNSTLAVWSKAQLKSANDPVAEFLKNVLAKNLIQSAVFLAIEVSQQTKSPVFRTKAALEGADAQSMSLWNGLEWNPQVFPDVWNAFLKTGAVEFTPPATMTNLTSSRNVIRGAFGLGKNGFLTLVRVGSAQACRGVLAVISEDSIVVAIEPFMVIAKS